MSSCLLRVSAVRRSSGELRHAIPNRADSSTLSNSMQELMKTRQDDPFYPEFSDHLRNTECRDAGGSVLCAQELKLACFAGSPVDKYLLGHKAFLLKCIATSKESVNLFKVVMSRNLRGAILLGSHDDLIAGHFTGSKVF